MGWAGVFPRRQMPLIATDPPVPGRTVALEGQTCRAARTVARIGDRDRYGLRLQHLFPLRHGIFNRASARDALCVSAPGRPAPSSSVREAPNSACGVRNETL